MAQRKLIAKPDTKLVGDPAVASHANKRMERMTWVGLILPKLLALKGMQKPKLSYAGASYQAGKGSRAEGTQAAHNLPRDILINDRPMWTYAEQLDAPSRIKLQVNYSSAATVTVPKEANHIDSTWERTSLPDDWLRYLNTCVDNAGALGKPGVLPAAIRQAAVLFKQRCGQTLGAAIERICASDYYDRHGPALEAYFPLYRTAVERFDPAARLEALWAIYQRPEYR